MAGATPPADAGDPVYELECWSCQKPFPFRASDVDLVFVKARAAARPGTVQCSRCGRWNRVDLAALPPPASPPAAP